MINKFLSRLYQHTVRLNERNIIALLEQDIGGKLLDLGCDDGNRTEKFGEKVNTGELYGIEVNSVRARKAKARDINVWIGDLDDRWPFRANYFDVVVANQVIEHVTNIDHFLSEMKRTLKPEGYAIISTENGSSWHNIFASVMGWQIFSSTNISKEKLGLGNPMAFFRNKKLRYSTWTHKTIFYYEGLREILKLYGFSIVSIRGSGYHPLLPIFGQLDLRHTHYLSIKVSKR